MTMFAFPFHNFNFDKYRDCPLRKLSNKLIPISTGCSSAWLERTPRAREAGGSNPLILIAGAADRLDTRVHNELCASLSPRCRAEEGEKPFRQLP